MITEFYLKVPDSVYLAIPELRKYRNMRLQPQINRNFKKEWGIIVAFSESWDDLHLVYFSSLQKMMEFQLQYL